MVAQTTGKAFVSRLLIVDDRPENLLSLRNSIDDLDIWIAEATAGEDALRMVAENQYFLIMLSNQMLGMTGYEVALQIRESPENQTTPIIFMTGTNKGDKAIFEGCSAGIVDYMPQSPGPDVIRNKVRLFHDLAIQQQEVANTVHQLEVARNELKRSNKELEDFAYLASHDLRAPLRSISSFSEILASGLEGKLDANQSEVFKMIQEATGRMEDMVEGLLEYSRAKSMPDQIQAVDLGVCLREVMALLGIRSKEKKAAIEIGELPVVKGYSGQLQQVFRNLVDNALKFMPPGREPRIVISSEVKSKDQTCEIMIKDNGIGFENSQVAQIFQPFKRLVGKGEFPGSGMGMAIVARIIENHGGLINAAGMPGEGAVFRLTLPLCPDGIPVGV